MQVHEEKKHDEKVVQKKSEDKKGQKSQKAVDLFGSTNKSIDTPNNNFNNIPSLQHSANNSPRVLQLQKMQEGANNSPRVLQLQKMQEMANNSPRVFQLQNYGQGTNSFEIPDFQLNTEPFIFSIPKRVGNIEYIIDDKYKGKYNNTGFYFRGIEGKVPSTTDVYKLIEQKIIEGDSEFINAFPYTIEGANHIPVFTIEGHKSRDIKYEHPSTKTPILEEDKPLKYKVGKNSDFKGITGKSFRNNHPLKDKGTIAGKSVYKEDLLDLTSEFKNLVKNGLPEFTKIKNYPYLIKKIAFYDLVNDDHKWDLKSRLTDDGTPSYAAIVIGEWSLMNGELRRYDDYGNISYGAFGIEAGFSEEALLKGSDDNQKEKDEKGITNGNGDTGRDIEMIKKGIIMYNNGFFNDSGKSGAW